MRALRFGLGLSLVLLSLSAAHPQQPATAPPSVEELATGMVSGTVLAEETQRAVRFAQVTLQSVASVEGAATGTGYQRQGPFGRTSAQTRTEVDGTFEAVGIAPGDYYVMAAATGYISQRSLLQEALATGADPAALLARIPVVHVVADATSSINVTLRRGGTLSGRVTWEDGSAASGLNLDVIPPGNDVPLPPLLRGLEAPQAARNAQTDDRGMFRFTGLATGDYVVRAVIVPAQQFGGTNGRGARYFSPILVYATGVFRRAEAKVYSIRAGDERNDVTMTVDLRNLRTVSGYVSSNVSGQHVASGRVVAADSRDRQLSITGMIAADGRFELRYVPPGTYTLSVNGASSDARVNRPRGDTTASAAITFLDTSQALQVGDVDVSGVGFTLTPATPRP